MQRITLETRIAAPIERCFLLSLSIDLHIESTAPTGEQAIAGVTGGLIGPGETVTWRGRHFGVMLTHKTLITHYDKPHHFQDVMIKGMFKHFEHDHFFTTTAANETLVRDELVFAAPLGPLGWIAETLVLRSYLRKFLTDRNAVIQRVAQSTDERWRKYLDTSVQAAQDSQTQAAYGIR
jgi:ligand-binding SRPBCC domain-containing protein